MSYPDAYDDLCDLALFDGVRIAPLFLVFVNPDPVKLWRVCTTNLMGDPTGTHSEHVALHDAIAECERMNWQHGSRPMKQEVENQPLTFREKILAKLNEILGGGK